MAKGGKHIRRCKMLGESDQERADKSSFFPTRTCVRESTQQRACESAGNTNTN